MRTSLSQQIQSALTYMNAASSRLVEAQQRAVTGKRILKTSDDVPGTNQSLSLRSAINTTNQLTNNTVVSKPLLNTTMSALNDMVQAVKKIRNVATSAGNSELTSGANAACIAELRDILGQMADIANTRHLDQYVFSGTATDSQPVTQQLGNPPYAYAGNDGVRKTQVLPWVTMSVGIPGSRVFNFDKGAGADTTDVFSMVTNLIEAIETGDPNQVSAQLTNIDKNLDNLLTCSAQVGSWAARMDKAQTTLSESSARLQQMLSDTEDIDLPSAVVALKTEENIYETALAVSGRILNLSLASSQYLQF